MHAQIIVGLAITLAAVEAYLVPSLVAWCRGVPGIGQIVTVNVLLGWTVIGWIVALVMAFRHVPQG